jgi:hypothetical protein
MAIERMNSGFYIQEGTSKNESLFKEEIDVTEEIFSKLGARFYFDKSLK